MNRVHRIEMLVRAADTAERITDLEERGVPGVQHVIVLGEDRRRGQVPHLGVVARAGERVLAAARVAEEVAAGAEEAAVVRARLLILAAGRVAEEVAALALRRAVLAAGGDRLAARGIADAVAATLG